MIIKLKKSTIPFSFIVFVTLISIRLWSFHGIPDQIYDILEVISLIGLLVICVQHFNKILNTKSIFKANVNLLILIPLFSTLGALIYHNQSLPHSLLILRTNFFWLIYYILTLYNIPPKLIVNFMIFIGIVWVVLTVGQQFTYPKYLFYTRSEEGGERNILRAGVYRFMLYRHHYGLFAVIYFYWKFLKTKAKLHLFMVVFGLIGFYYYGTRQFALIILVCLAIASITQKGKVKLFSLVAIGILFGGLIYFSDTLFNEYIELTNNQLSEDNIRVFAANFYLFEYWPHWSTIFTGNGLAHSYSNYGKEMSSIQENFHFYRSDVGIIGAFNNFGVFYIINLIWLIIKGLRKKYYFENSKFLKLIFINILLLLIISEHFSHPSAIPFFCFVFYLVDKSSEFKKREKIIISRKLHIS